MNAPTSARFIARLARPEIVAMDAYASARNAGWSRILLDANESAEPPLAAAPLLNRYPLPQDPALLARLAALYNVAAESLMIGRGADEAIDILPRVFCRAGLDGVVLCPPTYGMYAVSARIQGAPIVEVPLRGENFGLDVDGIVSAVARGARLVFICAPSNPLGTPVSQREIVKVLDGVGERAIVVVDEAYIEFSGADSCAPLTTHYENLVVLRTLSKAYALAGARCGVAIATPSVITLLNKVRAPYPLSRPAVEAVLGALNEAETAQRIARVRTERERMARSLRDMPGVVEVLPSVTNFLFVRLRDERAVLARCAADDIRIRDRSDVGLGPAVRITIGTSDENNAVADAFAAASTTNQFREAQAYA